jgi:hypothetical protein
MPRKKKVPICTATFARMWSEGTPTRVIAETLKITADRCDLTRRELGLPKRKSWHGAKKGRRATYLPTPDEILTKCKEFQNGWTEEERKSRIVGKKSHPAEIQIIAERYLEENTDTQGDQPDSISIEDLIKDSSG